MAEPQTLARSAVLPVVVTLSVVSVVLALLVASIAPGEYHHFEHEAERHGSGGWPSFTENTKLVPFLGLVLAIPTVGFGIRLLRNPDCRPATLLWYCSVVIFAHLLWLVVSFLSVYLLYVKFYHWL